MNTVMFTMHAGDDTIWSEQAIAGLVGQSIIYDRRPAIVTAAKRGDSDDLAVVTVEVLNES